MKFLTIAAIVVYLLVPITNVQAQTDLAVLSAYVTKFHSREKSVTFLKRFENFIIDQQIDAEVATGLSPYISNGLSTIFKLKDSDSYTGLSEYKTLLDEYKLCLSVFFTKHYFNENIAHGFFERSVRNKYFKKKPTFSKLKC